MGLPVWSYLEFIRLLDDHLQLGVLAQRGAAHLGHVLWSHRCLVVIGVSCTVGQTEKLRISYVVQEENCCLMR